MELNDTICYCFHVSKRKIRNFIRIHKPKRASQVSECGGAGTGCGWCVSYIQRYYNEMTEGPTSESDALTPEEYARQRGEYIKAGGGVPPSGAIPPPADESNET